MQAKTGEWKERQAIRQSDKKSYGEKENNRRLDIEQEMYDRKTDGQTERLIKK